MRFEIAATVPEPERVKKVCRQVARAAHVSTAGLLVRVEMHHRSRHTGMCYGGAAWVSRKGRWVEVNGYIKVRFTDWEKLAHTFAHELSHLKDARLPRVPWGRERRAEAFAERIIARVEAQG